MHVIDGNHWITVKEVADLTSGDADAVEDAIGLEFQLPDSADAMTPEQIGGLVRSQITMTYDKIHLQRDALFSVLITDWDLGIPLPSEDIASCKKIPLTLRYKLEEATQDQAVALRRRPDPKATTSSASNGSSRGGARA